MGFFKRRAAPALLAVFLTLSCSSATLAYSDTSATWAAEVIEKAASYGLMEGYPDGRFGVGDPMTRAEFVTVLCRMFGWEISDDPSPIHRDCEGHWALPYIFAAQLHGVEDHAGLFFPDDYISREEMARMLVQALGYDRLAQSLSQIELPFDDVAQNKGYIALAYDFGIINGVDTNGQLKFLPSSSAPREQAAAMLVRCYERYSSSTDWLHGFYALSSYSQIDYMDRMNAVSVGWAQMQLVDGRVLLNDTSAHGNEWVKPQGTDLVTGRLAERSIPCNLNVFANASAFAGMMAGGQREEMTAALVEAARPYAGLTIDFEGLKEDQRDNFTAFLTALRSALPREQTLYLCVPPDTWFGGYDYRALGELCDRVILMAHDYQWSSIPDYYLGTGNTYCPVTPFDQVYTALRHVTDRETGVEDLSKVALAISFNTTGFHVDENGMLLEATFYHPAKETIAQRLRQPDTLRTWDEASRNPYIQYTTEDGEHYKLWYEDARSVADKLALARMFGVTGVSVWRLGTIPEFDLPDYNVWSTIIGSTGAAG